MLNIVKVNLVAKELARFRARTLPAGVGVTFDYIAHGVLRALFGLDPEDPKNERGAIRPFTVLNDRASVVPVLGYTRLSKERCLNLFLNSEASYVCKDEPLILPVPIENGVIPFKCRAIPIARRTVEGGKKKEIPVFESNRFAAPTAAESFHQWFNEQVKPFTPHDLTIEAQTVTLSRRKEDRFFVPFNSPMITVCGKLTVSNTSDLEHLLAKGVGRHKGFGFGMIQLTG